MTGHRRVRTIHVLALSLLLALILAAAAPILAQGGVTVTTNSSLRLRSGPSTAASILATVPAGTSLTATGTNASRNWVVVTYNGITGWMAASFLRVNGSLNSLPVVANAGDAPTAAPGQQNVAPSGGVIVAPTVNLRMRSGPGTNNAVITTIPRSTQIQALAVNADRTWVQVTFSGRNGWVARAFLRVLSGSIDTLTNTPQQAATAPPPQNSSIAFTATAYNVTAGQCVTLSWNVTNVREVYYQGQGVPGTGSRQECPSTTTTYVLRVVFQNGQTVDTPLTVTVTPAPVSPTPTATRTPTPTAVATLNFSLPPNYGSTSLTSGFVPDPFQVGITSGGSVNVGYLGSGCTGFTTSAPDFSVNYTSGAFPTLRFYFIGSGDSTMVINAPSGSYFCVDDSFGTLNPTIDFNSPSSGRYDIWIGSYTSGTFISGTLSVTENTGNHP